MKAESIVLAIAGAFFGLIVGWILGSQLGGVRRPPAAAAAQMQAAPPSQAQPPRTVDEAEVQALRGAAEREPQNVQPRIQLGNLFFDAERYDEAVTWYRQALAIDPGNPDVSTDLGVSYYYLNRPDEALAQFERSLAADPRHGKTLLNQGIVRAFGKQDLAGAAASWQRLIEMAPDSPEGQAARRALESLRAAHPEVGSGTPGPTTGQPKGM